MPAAIGAEAIVLTADPQPFEAGLDRMRADLQSFGAAAPQLAPPPATATAPSAAAGLGRRGVLQPGEDVRGVTRGFDAAMNYAMTKQEAAQQRAAKAAGQPPPAAGAGRPQEETPPAAGGFKSARELAKAQRQARFEAAGGAMLDVATAKRIAQVATVSSVVGGVATAAIAATQRPEGQAIKPSDTMNTIGQFAAQLPYGLGTIASTITGVLGGLFDALTRESRIVAERAGAALASIATGARNAATAVQSVGLESMQTDLQNIMRDAANGSFRTFNDAQAVDPMRLGIRLREMETRANNAQRVTAAMAANPALAAQVGNMAVLRERQSATETVTRTQQQAGQSNLQAELLAQGRSVQEAADAAARFAQVQRVASFAIAAGVPPAQAMADAQGRLAVQLGQVAAAQQLARAAEATRAVGESIRGGREDLEVTQRRFEVIQNLSPFVADMTREEQELARLRREGASDAIVAQRGQQIEQLRAQRENIMIAEAGRQTREQTRNPLEEFDRQRDSLQRQFDNLEIDPETFGRGLMQAQERLIGAAGEVPPGQQAAMEGSAQAASLIARANRQMEREDRGAEMARAVRELREVAERSRQDGARAVQLLGEVAGGRVFRAVAPPGGG